MYHVGVDTGGTFTDFVALNADTGAISTFKVPSVPDDPAQAVLAGVERLRDRHGVDPSRIGRFIFGTTVATNAVLERKGARTALVATRGTRDVIEIQRLWRSRLFDLYIRKPPPLVPRRRRFEAYERIGARGEVVTPLTDREAQRIAELIAGGGFEAVAICCLFSFLDPTHERRLRDAIADAAPNTLISISSDVSPEFREYERAATTVMNAYVMPRIERLASRLEALAGEIGCAGQMIGQADHVPSHQGSLARAARMIAEDIALDPEDVVILNHPYEGGTHHPDIMIFKPVFHEGHLVAIAAALGHHIDVGGRSPGSISTDARDVFEEGLMIPPLKLYRRGELVPEILRMIEANIRVPEKTLGDIRAEIGAVTVGERRYLELVERYGRDELAGIVAAVLDHSEALMREDLARLPDGSYSAEGFMDSDGIADEPVRIFVTVTLKDGSAVVDFTGTDRQLKGPFNCSHSSVYSAVYAGIRYMTNPIIRQNEGCFRPIEIVRPEGTVVNPVKPAPISGRFTTLERIADTIVQALNQARGEDQAGSGLACVCSFAANGTYPDSDRRFVCFEIFGGGWGATMKGDGLSASFGLMANSYDTPIEAVELEYPLRVENYNLVTDSGGPGRNRGGLGHYRHTRYLHGEGYYTNRSETSKFPPKGVLGGMPGAPSKQRLVRADGTVEALPSKITNVSIHAGDLIWMSEPGGGGYGDPLDREPERVLEDLLDEKIGADVCRDVYGVVVADGAVDRAATAARRAELRAAASRP